MAKFTEQEKQIIAIAHQDWNQQCKDFMMHKKPFRDKTLQACLKRHGLNR